MNTLRILAAALPLAALCPSSLLADNGAKQEDVTSAYIANASFEADDTGALQQVTNPADGLRGWGLDQPRGWTVTGTSVTRLLVTKDCYADNNFGLVTSTPDGAHAYYLRMGWSSGTTTVAQTLRNLPAGRYVLTCDQRTGYANAATSGFTLAAGGERAATGFGQGSDNVFATLGWTTSRLAFSTAADGDVDISVSVDWLPGGSCIMLDNVRLYRVEGDTDIPAEPTESDVSSPTEGVVTRAFVPEHEMKDDLLQMLADFAAYMKNDYQDAVATNSAGEACGCFRGEDTMGSGERGVRPNADLSMVCAFLVKYGKGKVALPSGVTWADLESMARKSLVFAYSTHKANKLKVCSDGKYWGSTSAADHVWESSLWAMSVAYSAFFQWDGLSAAQRECVYRLLKAECNYELERSIPTGYAGDTKAEENGWEADVLAATLGLFPDDALAPRWFERLREFAINSYSHAGDATDGTVIDPAHDGRTVSDLYAGKNLYDDYTLQNHNLFHTSYQNVVMQELGEAALALKLFQLGTAGREKWATRALMHNNQKVMDEVLNWLALSDGELAMPNGNDWSLFLYDQITSYSTQACFQRDANALLLENLAYKHIKARQSTTGDGSWLLNADVGARRMGVQAHRVMMTWLMHEALPTADLAPATWEEFSSAYGAAKTFPSQNVVRASTDDRFTCFSWSSGLRSYTGYFASSSTDKNKIVVPFRQNNTGNFLGWYAVDGKATDAVPVVSGVYDLQGRAYTMNGELNTNGASLNNRFAIYSTPGNAVVYLDYVRANSAATISREQGGLLAVSTDPFTKTRRTLYTPGGAAGDIRHRQSDGTQLSTFDTDWINIDNEIGVVAKNGKQMAFGDRSLNNSIHTSKLYTSYSGESRAVKRGDVVDRRNITYYCNVDAKTTAAMAEELQVLTGRVPEGWNGVIAADPDGTNFLLLANFASDRKCELADVACRLGAPVFAVPTRIAGGSSAASFIAETNHSVSSVLRVFVEGDGLTSVQCADNAEAAYIRNDGTADAPVSVSIVAGGAAHTGSTTLAPGGCVRASASGGGVQFEDAEMPPSGGDDPTEGYLDITAATLANPSFEEDATYGDANGNVTLGSTTYNPCYTNSVGAADASYPNILPVKGWTAGNALGAGSNFARMYSMPYSTTLFCVSPSNVGNYAAQCARPVSDDAAGARCLTVLNSWATGANRVTQTARLPKGSYRLLLDMRYECTTQQSNNGREIVGAGNTNTSLTGIRVGAATDYRYPAANATWEQMRYDFTLDQEQDVEISLGFRTSASVGAASNSLLYIDNVRLLASRDNEAVGARRPAADSGSRDIYSLTGTRVAEQQGFPAAHLPRGIYISGNKKILVH